MQRSHLKYVWVHRLVVSETSVCCIDEKWRDYIKHPCGPAVGFNFFHWTTFNSVQMLGLKKKLVKTWEFMGKIISFILLNHGYPVVIEFQAGAMRSAPASAPISKVIADPVAVAALTQAVTAVAARIPPRRQQTGHFPPTTLSVHFHQRLIYPGITLVACCATTSLLCHPDWSQRAMQLDTQLLATSTLKFLHRQEMWVSFSVEVPVSAWFLVPFRDYRFGFISNVKLFLVVSCLLQNGLSN